MDKATREESKMVRRILKTVKQNGGGKISKKRALLALRKKRSILLKAGWVKVGEIDDLSVFSRV